MRIYRSPDGGEGGGDATSEADAAAALVGDLGADAGGGDADKVASSGAGTVAAAVNMESKVTLADGTVVTVGDLVQSRSQLGEARTENTKLGRTVSAVKSLFDENTEASGREAATRHILAESGYNPDEIEHYLSITGLSGTGDDDSGEEYDDEGEGAAAEKGSMSVAQQNRMRELENQVEAQGRVQHKARVQQLNEMMNRELDATLDSHPQLKVLFDGTKSIQGANLPEADKTKAVQKAKDAVRRQLKRQALDQLSARRAEAGAFDDSWFAEEINKAVPTVLDIYQSVIGDINRLGRTPETVAGRDSAVDALLSREPVAAPVHKVGDDNSTKVKEWAEDTLSRLAVGSGKGSQI